MKLLMKKNRMVTYKFLFFFLIIIFSCSKSNEATLLTWQNSMKFYETKDYNNCLVALHSIIEDYPDSEYTPKAIYMISEIYLNEYNEYDIAQGFLKEILLNYPDTEIAKKALFTLAYINANYIESFSESIDYYSKFLEKYPDDSLIPSVEYELENLYIMQNKIDSLINLNKN